MRQATLFPDAAPASPPLVPAARRVPFEGHYGPRAIVCPTCRANVGANCVRPSGHSPTPSFGGFHAARTILADEVALVGLFCARCGAPDGPGCYVAPILDDLETLGLPVCQPCVWDWRQDVDAPDFGPKVKPGQNQKVRAPFRVEVQGRLSE
ncbi:MAG: hypothetical protein QOI63_990 [Thermoplasmata archaeon]|jgi:hypothetical protein|nr:hypothetical protein [Thermoplasmata archaeon]